VRERDRETKRKRKGPEGRKQKRGWGRKIEGVGERKDPSEIDSLSSPFP